MATINISDMCDKTENGHRGSVDTKSSKRGHYGVVSITNLTTKAKVEHSCEGRHLCDTDAMAEAIAFRQKIFDELKPQPSTESLVPLDHLPELGETIFVQNAYGIHRATIISMHACRLLKPEHWGKDPHDEAKEYGPDDTIRAFLYADAEAAQTPADFCIMRFNTSGLGVYTYNKNVFTSSK